MQLFPEKLFLEASELGQCYKTVSLDRDCTNLESAGTEQSGLRDGFHDSGIIKCCVLLDLCIHRSHR